MTTRIGYLAPEFPGQTHQFLWREVEAFTELGLDPVLVSTRRPPSEIVCHRWAKEAQAHTNYLVPLSAQDMANIARELMRAGPARWAELAEIIGGESDLTPRQRVRLASLIVPAAKLAAIARSEGFDHVHVASCSDAANIAMLASVISGLRYSLALLGPTLEVYGPNQRNKWSHAAFAVVMSKLLYGVVQERLAGSLPPIVEVSPVGVDLEVMRRAEPYVPYQGEGVCRIYCCGRLNPIKGHPFLIDAVTELRGRGLNAEVFIAGEDEKGGTGYRRELEAHVESQGAGAYVHLLGALSEDKHRDWLQRAHVFALASLNEGISVALMEAMAMQIPVVATRVGGNHELIDDGVNALFVPPEQPDALADALERVLRNPELASRLSEASRRKVEEEFDSRASARIVHRCLHRATRP